jgi:mono/diheme cytochrome c family protein
MERVENSKKGAGNRHSRDRSVVFAVVAFAALVSFASRRGFAQAGGAAPAAKAEKPAADKPPTGNAQNGKALFTNDGCYECHGREAQGGLAPRLGPRAINLALLLSYVRQPTGEMPPYTSRVISDAELTDIFAFLQSLPEPPKAADIPLLNPK